jgi:hypothetical protein
MKPVFAPSCRMRITSRLILVFSEWERVVDSLVEILNLLFSEVDFDHRLSRG